MQFGLSTIFIFILLSSFAQVKNLHFYKKDKKHAVLFYVTEEFNFPSLVDNILKQNEYLKDEKIIGLSERQLVRLVESELQKFLDELGSKVSWKQSDITLKNTNDEDSLIILPDGTKTFVYPAAEKIYVSNKYDEVVIELNSANERLTRTSENWVTLLRYFPSSNEKLEVLRFPFSYLYKYNFQEFSDIPNEVKDSLSSSYDKYLKRSFSLIDSEGIAISMNQERFQNQVNTSYEQYRDTTIHQLDFTNCMKKLEYKGQIVKRKIDFLPLFQSGIIPVEEDGIAYVPVDMIPDTVYFIAPSINDCKNVYATYFDEMNMEWRKIWCGLNVVINFLGTELILDKTLMVREMGHDFDFNPDFYPNAEYVLRQARLFYAMKNHPLLKVKHQEIRVGVTDWEKLLKIE